MANSHRDQIIGAIDEIDVGLALLRTAYLATTAEGGILQNDIEAITATLYQSLRKLEPVREGLQELTCAMPIVGSVR